jgi:hypothetical protein
MLLSTFNSVTGPSIDKVNRFVLTTDLKAKILSGLLCSGDHVRRYYQFVTIMEESQVHLRPVVDHQIRCNLAFLIVVREELQVKGT